MTDSYLYKIKQITDQDKESVLLFLQQFFYKDEPLNEYLDKERGKEIICKSRGQATINIIDEGFSFMAVSNTNEIIGISVNGIPKENSAHDDHPNPIKISKLICKLEEEYANLTKLNNANDTEMNVKQISVNSEWRNKGIALDLLKYTRELAIRKGFHQIRSTCTSEYSAKIFEKLGFQCVYTIKYEDYKEDGKVVFKPDPPHTAIKMMILQL